MALPLQGWVSLGKMPPLGLPSSPLRLVLGKQGQLWTPVQGLGPGSVAAHIFTQNLQKDTLHSVPVHNGSGRFVLTELFFQVVSRPTQSSSQFGGPARGADVCEAASARQPTRLRNEQLGAHWFKGTCHPTRLCPHPV